jgi:SWIM zinc finger
MASVAAARPAPKSARKPRPRPARSVSLLEAPAGGTPGLIRITVGRESAVYWLEPIPSQCGGIAFGLRRFRAADTYHVRIDVNHRSCDCPAGTYRGPCKHQDALEALRSRGRLPAVA